MDNKQISPWEDDPILPDAEITPLFQELDFQPEESAAPLIPETAEPESLIAETPVYQELSMDTDSPEFPAVEEEIIEEAVELPISVYPQEDAAYVSADAAEPVPAQEENPADQAESIPSGEPEVDLELDILSDPAPIPAAQPEPAAEESLDEEYRDNIPASLPEEKPSKKKKAADPRPTLKGRPKRKRGEGFFGIPNILATGVWLALILAIGVTMGRMIWVCAADVLAFGREDKRVTLTIYEADTMEDVVDKLYEAGLIRYKGLFNLYASISDAEEEIKPGIYDLNTRYDYHALVNSMSPSSSREVIELTIPEGYTCRQIFALLEENRVCTAVDIATYAMEGTLSDYWFLEGLDRSREYCLEGYLFPDTYQFYKNSTPREALEKMLDNFDYRFSEEMRARIDVLNENVTDGSYGIREVVIVASLIEKESAAPSESPTIASVIYNRLFNWDYPALLNIDAAIVYAQGGDAERIDTSIDSPYNTYRYTGLTPTAISNPGLSSLKAALNPENTDYYYYVLNPATGMHQFSKTQEEHDKWIAEFYNR